MLTGIAQCRSAPTPCLGQHPDAEHVQVCMDFVVAVGFLAFPSDSEWLLLAGIGQQLWRTGFTRQPGPFLLCAWNWLDP